MLSNFHVQIKQKTSYLAIAILLVSVLFASCVLPSLKFGSASIEMNIAIPQYMEKTEKIDSSARFIHPDAEKLVVSIEASDMDTETYEFPMKSGVNTISIKNLSPGKNRTITVSLHNKNTDQVLAENNKTVNLKTGQNNLSLVLKPVPTDGSFKTNESTGILDLKIDNLTGLAGKTQVYAFDIEFAGAYEIDAEFNDDGNESFAYSLNIYDEAGKKVVKNVDESEDIYTFEEGRYFFVVSIPENATITTFTVEITPYGSEHAPILIASASDLKKIGSDTASKYYKQTADISLTGEWTPITKFEGHYDGDNFKITGLTITTTDNYAGLFGMLKDAEVKNVRLIDIEINTTNGVFVGGLAGSVSSSTIENCHVSGKITVNGSDSTSQYVGGLVGSSTGIIINQSSSTVNIKTEHSGVITATGGLIGSMGGTNVNSTVTECFSLGSLESNTASGGLIGAVSILGTTNLTVEKSFSAVEIKVADNSDAQFGGLIASTSATSNASINIKNSYATGSISKGSDVDADIGGFIGKIFGTIDIQGSWSSGDVGTTTPGGKVGLFVGTVDGTGTKKASNSYVQMPTTGGGEIIGNGSISGFTPNTNAKTQSQMLKLNVSDASDASYLGDSSIWIKGSSTDPKNYPYLEWQEDFTVDQGKPWDALIPSPTP